jgi:hypothetical protein
MRWNGWIRRFVDCRFSRAVNFADSADLFWSAGFSGALRRRRGISFGESFFGGGGFDLAVDLCTEQKHESGYVEPCEQNDDGPERAVGVGVEVEEVEIDAQGERSEEPEEDADGSAGGEPVPATCLDVGCPVIDDCERESEESRGEKPADNAGDESDEGGEEVICDGVTGEGTEEVSAEQTGQGESDDAGEEDGDSDGRDTRHDVRAGFIDLVHRVECFLNGGDAD